MANITLGWTNRIDGATLSGGSWVSTLPLDNMKNRQVQKVAQTTDATLASTKFQGDFGRARTIGVMALILHNISAIGKVRLRMNDTNSFATPLYDSGWVNAWADGAVPQNLLEWEDDNFWLGTMSDEDRAGYQSPFIHVLSTQQYLRYFLIEVDDTTNADGYIYIGRPFMSATWTPEVNHDVGDSLGYEDSTLVESSLSNAKYFDTRNKPRAYPFELSWLTGAEAFGEALDLQRLCGTSGEVLVIPDPDDVSNMPKRAFVGRMRALNKITRRGADTFSQAFELEELL